MAKRKTGAKKSLGCLFWIAFAIVVFGLFLLNREAIRRTLDNTQFLERVLKRPAATPQAPTDQPATPVSAPQPEATKPAPSVTTVAPAPAAPVPAPAAPVPTPAAPQAKPAPVPIKTPVPAAEPKKPVQELRSRTIYLMRIDADGTIARTKVARSLPVSDSPMTDAVAALLAGPTVEEAKKGYSSLIPKGTRLLSALRRGKTAYLSFSEEFQFNTFGAPGYIAQLQQVVWTATEFPEVEDVQILIEGRIVNFLGAEVPIGAPINQDTLK